MLERYVNVCSERRTRKTPSTDLLSAPPETDPVQRPLVSPLVPLVDC